MLRKFLTFSFVLCLLSILASCSNGGQQVIYKCDGSDAIVRYTDSSGDLVEKTIDTDWEKSIQISPDVDRIQLLASKQGYAGKLSCGIYIEEVEVVWDETKSGLIFYLEQEEIQNPKQFDLGTPKLVFSNVNAQSICGLYLESGRYDSERGWEHDILLGDGELPQGRIYQIVGLPVGEYSILTESCKWGYTPALANTLSYNGENTTLTIYDPGDNPANGFTVLNNSSKDICEVIITNEMLAGPINALGPKSVITMGKKHTFGITQGLFSKDVSIDFTVVACDRASFSVKGLSLPTWDEPTLEVTDKLFQNGGSKGWEGD